MGGVKGVGESGEGSGARGAPKGRRETARQPPTETAHARPSRHRPARWAYGFGQDLYAELRALYRAAFQRLDAQGRIEQAAFVLAELLQANEEAVSYLERHGRLRLAAEMA